MKKNTNNWVEQVLECKNIRSIINEKKIKDFKKIEQAIDDSIMKDKIAELTAYLRDVIATGEQLGYEVDYAEYNDGSWDVWGWTDDTKNNDTDWRLSVQEY